MNMADNKEVITGGLSGEIDTEAALGEAEPWEDWETSLVLWSLGIGITCLVVFGIIVNLTILK